MSDYQEVKATCPNCRKPVTRHLHKDYLESNPVITHDNCTGKAKLALVAFPDGKTGVF